MHEELKQLENLISEMDYLMNEGVVITLPVKEQFKQLLERGLLIMEDFNHINDNGNLQILNTEFTNPALLSIDK